MILAAEKLLSLLQLALAIRGRWEFTNDKYLRTLGKAGTSFGPAPLYTRVTERMIRTVNTTKSYAWCFLPMPF